MTICYSDYKSRLIKLNLSPLIYVLNINDIMFFINSLNCPHDGLFINNFIKFIIGHSYPPRGTIQN